MERPIYIAVIGDDGAGKSSLIHTLATEFFEKPDVARRVLRPFHITVDASGGGEVPLVIYDTPPMDVDLFAATRHEGHSVSNAVAAIPLVGALLTRLHGGEPVDAVVLAFDAGNDVAFRRLSTHWLPFLAALRSHFGVALPVVVAENRIDVRRQLQAAAAVAAAAQGQGQRQSTSDQQQRHPRAPISQLGGSGIRRNTLSLQRAARGNAAAISARMDPVAVDANPHRRQRRGDVRLVQGKLSPGLTRFSPLLRKFSGISACVACSSQRQLNVMNVRRLYTVC